MVKLIGTMVIYCQYEWLKCYKYISITKWIISKNVKGGFSINRKYILLFLALIFICGCSNSHKANKDNEKSPDNESDELSISKDDRTSFIVNGKTIKVNDETSSITSIISLEWIDKNLIGVLSHINPSLDYYTIYDIENDKFIYSAYGTNFVWNKEDINTLIYIENPPHLSSSENQKYKIKDYKSNILYESNDQISDLQYDDNKIVFYLLKDGKKIKKILWENKTFIGNI